MLRASSLEKLITAISSREPVLGFTHEFYRYPARFSPIFARTAIEAFTKPGDLIIDPFMGGGTTLVESRILGRHAIGVDISELAVFISRVKTTLLSHDDQNILLNWANGLDMILNLHNRAIRANKWIDEGYQRNINDKSTWPIRKTIELALAHINELHSVQQKDFIRCALLKTGQWALDCRRNIPSAKKFRIQLIANINRMIKGMIEFSDSAIDASNNFDEFDPLLPLCLNRSVIGLDSDPALADIPSPKLILTSPPYPGVHVLYHRWQVKGRRETPAPFWIADCVDGHGASYYTFGHRDQPDLTNYFNQIYKAYTSMARIANDDTLLVQMVAFSDPSWQFSKFLQVMEQAGFCEVKISGLANSIDGRLWRCVPNRKWYADHKGEIPSSKEVVLFHHLAPTQHNLKSM